MVGKTGRQTNSFALVIFSMGASVNIFLFLMLDLMLIHKDIALTISMMIWSEPFNYGGTLIYIVSNSMCYTDIRSFQLSIM